MRRHLLLLICTAIYITAVPIGHAEAISTAIMSPNCTADQIKALAGSALAGITENDSWDHEVKGFVISLDTNKLSYSDLIDKMQTQGCFK